MPSTAHPAASTFNLGLAVPEAEVFFLKTFGKFRHPICLLSKCDEVVS